MTQRASTPQLAMASNAARATGTSGQAIVLVARTRARRASLPIAFSRPCRKRFRNVDQLIVEPTRPPGRPPIIQSLIVFSHFISSLLLRGNDITR